MNDEINNLNGAIATDVSLIKANDNDNKGALDIRGKLLFVLMTSFQINQVYLKPNLIR